MSYSESNSTYLIVLISIFTSSCIDFSISDEDAREELKESNTAIQFGDLTHEDYRIHYAYTDQNRDYLIIFIHGSPGSWNAFIDFFKADSILSYSDMVAIDRPGFGLSNPGTAEPSMETQAKLMHLVCKQFDQKNKILIGHSLGGPVIARMVMDYPENYQGLIMVAPSIDPEMEKEEWYRSVINSKVGGWLTPQDFEVSNDEIIPLKNELILMLPHWSHIKIPTIVIQGTDDSLVPKENADFAEKVMEDSVLTINLLEGVDHFIPWSDPKEIIEAIRQMTVPQ